MEDLYGNLDNYNEVNALEELRSENKELKVKLEEYATAMEKLQKNILQEFDTVSSEYKKLEHNYSSLLKTAKAEIERKTQIITNMNIEKDMMVLSALQNGNRCVLKAKQCMPNALHNFKKNNNGAHKKNMKNAKVHENQNKKNDTVKERLQEHQMSSEDIRSKENPQEMTTRHKPALNPNPSINVMGSATDEHNAKSGQSIHNMSVKHRRKSNVGDEKWSLDEMGDGLTGGSKYDNPTRHKEDRKSFTKNHNDKYIGKGPETSSMDDKFSPHVESSRDSFKTRPGKYYNGDKHRSRERNDNSQRYKRYHSPERYNKKPRDYDEYDYNQRLEFSRSRGKESPSNDRFHHNSHKEHRQYEKYHLNEQDRYIHGQDKYVGKHKTPHEYDEPNRKRQKTECYGRLKEDEKWHDRELFKVQELTETFEQLEEQYISCQSPDHITCETATEPIKVIRNTAETQLEDPRLVTNKYILSNDKGSVTLSTINSKHVNILPIDKKKWGMQKISMPDALMQLPPEDQLMKDLYADIDQRNMLTEKSDISIHVQNATSEHITEDIPDSSNYIEDTTNRPSATQKVEEKVDKPAPGPLSSYKIPKIKKSVKENKNYLKERSLDKIDNLCLAHDKDLKYRLTRNRSKSPSDKHGNNDAVSESATHTVSQNDMNLQASERVFSTREIVVGDLELSDETCDNTELQKTITQNTSEHELDYYQKSNLLHTEDIPNQPSIYHNQSNETDKYSDCVTETNFQNQKLQAPEEIITQHQKTEDHVEVHKKHKSKKKTHKHRDSEHLDVFDKKPKAKKDKKEKPKEVKTKFNDLFGESSSLITPDDLGIPVTNVATPSQLTLNYVPIFEDAIDATDLEQNIKTPIIPQTKDNENAPALVPVSVGNNGKVNVIESKSKINEISKEPLKLESHNGQTLNEQAPIINKAEDLNLENSNKESDIVATIIISTGIQPDEINSESRAESLVNAEELLSDNIEQDQNYETNKHQDLLIKALATSTPHKQVVNQIALEIDSKLPEPSCDSNSRMANIDNFSNTNNTSQQPNEDLPDVRIFVKRRRRLVKPAK